MEKLVSIIVPVYNVEAYLDKCVTSLVMQTYKNIEIILVDDGSTDSSSKICDKWSIRDSRIRVIHKENQGLSAARNDAIDIARGKLFAFVDSDDFVVEDMIATLIYYQNKFNADIVQGEFCKFIDGDEIPIIDKPIKYNIVTGIEAIKNIYYKKPSVESIVVWNKLYNADLFKKIRFPIGKIHEDEFTTYKLFYLASKVIYINKVIYLYRQRNQSIMSEGFNIKRLQWLEANEERIDFIDKNINDKELSGKAIESYGNRIMDYHYLLNKYYKNDKENLNLLLNKAKKIKKRYMQCDNISLLSKIKFNIWLWLNPLIYSLNKIRRKVIPKK
ncbi:glycosyltransferase [Clostridium sp. MSJ-8]|uniref:glycosyltransferase n=1 Tax=Clostridium sp. MSJ-8 TaxID=2841510 RepID=UPI001C0F01D9|nr:glycosyltransferase [Clostridium sp. MSJ-8]MBU5487107.1 glycosyltransferase [Clostridium sp. MSJ-8]